MSRPPKPFLEEMDATVDPGAAPPVPDVLPEGQAMQAVAALSQKRGSGLTRFAVWAFGALFSFALSVAGLGAAAWYFGVPQWLPGAGQTFGADRPDLELAFPPEKQDRRKLPNGTEYFGASGTVTNVGKDVRVIPEILIVLRDSRDKVVKTWEVPPPKEELAPGESVTINAAVTDVPQSAKVAEIGWKPD